ncbi:MAG TPA: hypothetical protein VMV43_10675 [Candidatus Nanopelagicaceae bacterium]|nr:hypothetical protein [Candidatus Nanopelagicaceae bacterium]
MSEKEKYGTTREIKQLYVPYDFQDLDKVFEFSKLSIKDIFREMKIKKNLTGKIRIDIKMKEVL